MANFISAANGIFKIYNQDGVEESRQHILHNARLAQQSVLSLHNQDPLEFLAKLKLDEIGFHPMAGKPLNFIEQLNQTFTYLTALAAAYYLFEWYSKDMEQGLELAPGASSRKENGKIIPDIISIESSLVAVEVFASVTPKNNDKLKQEIDKFAIEPKHSRNKDKKGKSKEFMHTQFEYRYVFFMSPESKPLEESIVAERDQNNVRVFQIDIEAAIAGKHRCIELT